MTTRTATPRRKGRARKPGFWSGLRKATHTDNLRHRVGGASGRAIVRGINRHRAKRAAQGKPAKPPIPIVGNWFGGKAPTQRKPTGRPAGRPKKPISSGGRAPKRGQEPAFSGPHVKATNKRRKAPLFGTSTTSTGSRTPTTRAG